MGAAHGDSSVTAPLLATSRCTLWCGDARLLMSELPTSGMVLVSDPPYGAFRYITEMEKAGRMVFADDIAWQADVFAWVSQWFPDVRARCTAAWLFCNVHYLGFYLRWAELTTWPCLGLLRVGPSEYLLHLSDVDPVGERAHVLEAVTANRYGHGKDLDMLRVLVRCSPPGIVIDPFCGAGGTLVAALAEGREAIGIEVEPGTAARAKVSLSGEQEV